MARYSSQNLSALGLDRARSLNVRLLTFNYVVAAVVVSLRVYFAFKFEYKYQLYMKYVRKITFLRRQIWLDYVIVQLVNIKGSKSHWDGFGGMAVLAWDRAKGWGIFLWYKIADKLRSRKRDDSGVEARRKNPNAWRSHPAKLSSSAGSFWTLLHAWQFSLDNRDLYQKLKTKIVIYALYDWNSIYIFLPIMQFAACWASNGAFQGSWMYSKGKPANSGQ